MTRRVVSRETLLTDSATARHAGFNVSDFRNVCLSIVGSSDASMTVYVKGAIGQARTNFDVNPSERDGDSAWDFIEAVDLEDGSAIDGDTGISIGNGDVRLLEVNVNELDWLAVEVTEVTAGTVSITTASTTNQ